MIRINKLSRDKIIEYKTEITLKLNKRRERIEKSEEYICEYDDIINDIFLKIDTIIGGELEDILNCYEDIRERYPDYLSVSIALLYFVVLCDIIRPAKERR